MCLRSWTNTCGDDSVCHSATAPGRGEWKPLWSRRFIRPRPLADGLCFAFLRLSGAPVSAPLMREADCTMSKGALPPILVVDDNHDNAEIIRQYLEIRGYPVTVAHSGDEALERFETVRPALVLLDVMMPGRDGWEVCRLMKQHPTLGRAVRVIMVTALDEWRDKREALQIGADDYVEKPFDLPTLAATVQRNLEMQQAKAS